MTSEKFFAPEMPNSNPETPLPGLGQKLPDDPLLRFMVGQVVCLPSNPDTPMTFLQAAESAHRPGIIEGQCAWIAEGYGTNTTPWFPIAALQPYTSTPAMSTRQAIEASLANAATTSTTTVEALIASTDNPCPPCCGRWLRVEKAVDLGFGEQVFTFYSPVNLQDFNLTVGQDGTSAQTWVGHADEGATNLNPSQTANLLAWMATCGIVDLGA